MKQKWGEGIVTAGVLAFFLIQLLPAGLFLPAGTAGVHEESSLEELLVRMHDAPAARFGIGSAIEKGAPADLTVFDLNAAYTVDPEDFVSMGKSTPFAGETLFGKCKLTMVGGGVVWQENSTEK